MFIDEMRASDIERLKAKKAKEKLGDLNTKLTIATVHKVKGLEYDTVLVMPSKEDFPFTRTNGKLPQPPYIDAAEEARLWYVAMTRARTQLHIGWDIREKSWWKRRRFESGNDSQRYTLKGSPKELFVSWPGRAQQVDNGLQEYIKSCVSIGDSLSMTGKVIKHGNMSVGLLSQNIAKRLQQTEPNPQIRVSNVIRYTCGPYFRENNQQFWSQLHDSVKQQEWFYIVLVEEA